MPSFGNADPEYKVVEDQGGKRPGDETGSLPLASLGPMCDAEKDWRERSFRASGAIP